jgi:hypothetical protein
VPGDGAAADPDVPAAPVEAAAAVPARAPGDPVEAPEASSPDTSEEAVVAPGEVPAAAAVPRVTPAQRVGVTPRPEPLPLRQSKPSAVPPSARAGAGAGRRAAAPDARRSATKPPREGRSAGTIALIVGLVVLILGGGAFVVAQLAGGDKAATPPNQAAPPPTQSSTPDTTADATPAPPAGDTNVAVLNGTTFNGLAGQVADRVAQEGGYQRGITETNTRDQTLQSSTVFYADGFRGSARAVAKLLSIDTTKPLDADTQALAPDADVVILAGADQAP